MALALGGGWAGAAPAAATSASRALLAALLLLVLLLLLAIVWAGVGARRFSFAREFLLEVLHLLLHELARR